VARRNAPSRLRAARGWHVRAYAQYIDSMVVDRLLEEVERTF